MRSRLYAATTPFHIKDLSVCVFWYLRASWNQFPTWIPRGDWMLKLGTRALFLLLLCHYLGKHLLFAMLSIKTLLGNWIVK